jgi:hypothetical protein
MHAQINIIFQNYALVKSSYYIYIYKVKAINGAYTLIFWLSIYKKQASTVRNVSYPSLYTSLLYIHINILGLDLDWHLFNINAKYITRRPKK